MSEQRKKYEDEIIIDIGGMIQTLLKKAKLIIAVGIICALAGFGTSKFLITPMYESTTKILVISRQNETMLTYADLQIGTVLTGDYIELVKSRNVLEAVIDYLDLDMTARELESRLAVEPVEDTRIVSISAKHENPVTAKNIVDVIREIVGKMFADVTSIESTHVVEDANLPLQPASPSVFKYTFVYGFLGAFIVAAVAIIQFILDDSIKTQTDVETYLDLQVLSNIPIDESVKTNTTDKKKKNKVKRR